MEDFNNKKRSLSSSSDSSDSNSQKKRKHKKKRKKEKKKHKKKSKKHDNDKAKEHVNAPEDSDTFGPSLTDLVQPTSTSTTAVSGKQQQLKPMTKEEWDKQQGELRHVYDAESGRTRLIRGSGEVMEEIVSKDRQKEINKMATKADGDYYASKTGTKR